VKEWDLLMAQATKIARLLWAHDLAEREQLLARAMEDVADAEVEPLTGALCRAAITVQLERLDRRSGTGERE
jgi:hypothetical protein